MATECPICQDVDPDDVAEMMKRHAAAEEYYRGGH